MRVKEALDGYPRELEENVADLWLKQGTITITDYGSENTYYVDEFDYQYFCKNYPNHVDS